MVETLDFKYMIFQADPRRQLVYYWLDGNPRRYRIKRDIFWNIAFNVQRPIIGELQQATYDYSFHMWNYVDCKVIHLLPNGANSAYRDPIMSVVTGDTKPIKDKPVSLEDQLLSLGFQAPTEDSIKNLSVSLTQKTNHVGMLQRVFASLRK